MRPPLRSTLLLAVACLALLAACLDVTSRVMSPDLPPGRHAAPDGATPVPRTAVLSAPVVERAPRSCVERGRQLLARGDTTVATVPVGPEEVPQPVPARSAYDFLSSIGINIHSTYDDTPYGDHDRLADALAAVGIRHVRDGLIPDRDHDQYPFLRRLARAGICTTALAGDPELDPGTIGDTLVDLEQVAPAVELIEGPNESDLVYGGAWSAPLRRYHTAFAEAVRAAGWTAPIVAPSFGRPFAPEEIGDLTDALDFGNIHPYPDGKPPSAHLDLNLRPARAVSGDAPVLATEHGYHTAAEAENAQVPVPEDVAATYVPRVYLESFAAGIARTYLYELLDEFPDPDDDNAEAQFGILTREYREKPAATALRTMIDLFEDAATRPHTTGALPLHVATEADAVRALLLQDVEGVYWVVLWRQVSVYDTERRERTDPGGVPVELVLDRPVEATVHRPAADAVASDEVRRGTRLEVVVPPDPIFVALHVHG